MHFSGLEIEGGYFTSPQEFHLFRNKNSRASLIYGKNGSGKSSISRAIKEQYNIALLVDDYNNQKEFTKITFKEFENSNSTSIKDVASTDILSLKIFVYNEDFIHENIQFKENGLDTIVMMGEQKDLEEKINELNRSIETQLKLYNIKNKQSENLKDKSNSNSPQAIFEAIKNKLHDRWGSTQTKIRNLKTNPKVNQALINEFLSHKESEDTYGSILEELSLKLNDLENINNSQILSTQNKIRHSFNFESLKELMERRIQEPQLNKNEVTILKLIQQNNEQSIQQSEDLMLDNNQNNCPLCFQSITPQHKHDVLNVIKKLLQTEEANQHIDELKKFNLSPISFNLSIYHELINSSIIESINSMTKSYNEELKKINDYILSKINNPYNPIQIESDLEMYLKNLNEKIELLNAAVIEFNLKFKNKSKLINELIDLNFKLAYKDIKELLLRYQEQSNIEKKLDVEIEQIIKEGKVLRTQLRDVESELANVHIACDAINDYLKYIFYDSNRISLEPYENYYLVKCRGNNVKLSSLSIGERNAISLCYFFSQLFKGKSIQDVFSDESLLVIDDPISSFDFENKIGVYSFLRFILSELHLGNSNSKSIILTHDLESFQHLYKIYRDIGYRKEIVTHQLSNQKLNLINIDSFNEYSILLQNIYDYATGTNHEKFDHSIGNTMRRVLEAFSTFNYKVGIEELSTNPKILNEIKSTELRNYFRNSMYRLVLHSESHYLERTKGLIDRDFIESCLLQNKSAEL